MLRSIACGVALLVIASAAEADFDADVEKASQAIAPALEKAEPLALAGKFDEADAIILNTFPEATRSPAEAYVLANIFFRQSPSQAYALHKFAAEKLPDNADVQYEWAIDQHRKGEYAGAAESYRKYLKSSPDFAPAYGLLADCLMRLGKTEDSLAAWKRSETAKNGSLETLESLVCDVHTPVPADARRRELVKRLDIGDAAAAAALIDLDLTFERDWWNSGPQHAYLKADLDRVRAKKVPDAKRLAAIECAAALGLADETDKASVTSLVKKHGLIVDENHTLPDDGALASFILSRALAAGAISRADAPKFLLPPALASAKLSKDAEMFNLAASLALGTDQLSAIDRLAWQTTGDARFAASLLAGRYKAGNLKAGDPELDAAIKQFPEDAYIAGVALAVAGDANQPLADLLTQGIRAEFSHFSSTGMLPRPRAATLRVYFEELDRQLNAPASKPTTAP